MRRTRCQAPSSRDFLCFGLTPCTHFTPARAQGDKNYLGEDVFRVDSILAKRTRKGGTEYLIKYEGYDSDSNTWEPTENVGQAAWLCGDPG